MDPSKRFELRESIGRDELGEVFKAAERSTGRAAAVKIFDAWAVESEESRQGFKSALVELRRIMPARTPPVADFHVDESNTWIASRWVGGKTLDDVLSEQGALDLDTASGIICGVLDALDELHSAGKAHGGLSPKKIILLDELNPGGVVITDPFQHHLYSVADPIKTSRNDPDRFLGLPQYFSPEQAQGNAPDTRSDVYVVGLLLYQLITGKAPFLARSVSTTLKRQIYEKPLPPRYAKPGLKIPKDAETIIYTALNKDADERFQAARAFRRALNNLRETVAEEEERTAAPLGIAPVGVLVGRPAPSADDPILDALRERDDEIEQRFDADEAEPEDTIDDSATDDAAAPAVDEDAPTTDSGNDGKAGDEEKAEDEDVASGSTTATGTKILSAVDALAAAERGGSMNAVAVDSEPIRSTDDDKKAEDESSDGDEADEDSESDTRSGRSSRQRAFKRKKPHRKRQKTQAQPVDDETEEPAASTSGDVDEGIETEPEAASADVTAASADQSLDTEIGADEEKATDDTSADDEGEGQQKSRGKGKRTRSRSKRRRTGAVKAPSPPVSEPEQHSRSFSEDSGELGWFAIGEDSQALKDLAGEIEDVEDHDQAHNRRFVVGLAALLAAGIFGVMLLSALAGSNDEEEEGDSDTSTVEVEDDPETSTVAAVQDTGSAQAAPDVAVEAEVAALGDIGEGSGEVPAEGSDELDGGDAEVGDTALAGDVALAVDTASEVDAAPEVAPEPVEDTVEEEEPVVAAVDPEEPEEPEVEPEEPPEPEVDPEEAEREANRARARELLSSAQSALDSRNLSEAEALFEEVISLDDSIASAHAGLGDVNFEQRSYSQAARHHRRATLLSSRNAEYHRKLGMDYFRLENYSAALASFEQAVTLGDSSASRYVSLVRERMGEPEDEEPESEE